MDSRGRLSPHEHFGKVHEFLIICREDHLVKITFVKIIA
jgi:hypothetical protein